MNRAAAEFLGTFFLVFAGTGAAIVDAQTHGGVTHVGVALTFGLVVMALIYSLGDTSGAHLNPAVTCGFVLAKRFPTRALPMYVVSQVAGAFAASATLRVLFPQSETLGATLPAGAAWQSLVLEILLTFMLMFVVLTVSSGSKERGIMAGAAIGAVVALEALFGGPVSGASMNPARSIAPAMISGHTSTLWIYLVGPMTGSALSVLAFRIIHPKPHAHPV